MKKIIEKIRKIAEEIKFILSDNTTAYGLTKEERIKIMEEYRVLRDLRDKEIKELVDKYKTTEEYISAGFFKKLWLDMKYGIFYDHRGEFRFDPERKKWCYKYTLPRNLQNGSGKVSQCTVYCRRRTYRAIKSHK